MTSHQVTNRTSDQPPPVFTKPFSMLKLCYFLCLWMLVILVFVFYISFYLTTNYNYDPKSNLLIDLISLCLKSLVILFLCAFCVALLPRISYYRMRVSIGNMLLHKYFASVWHKRFSSSKSSLNVISICLVGIFILISLFADKIAVININQPMLCINSKLLNQTLKIIRVSSRNYYIMLTYSGHIVLFYQSYYYKQLVQKYSNADIFIKFHYLTTRGISHYMLNYLITYILHFINGPCTICPGYR